MEQYELAKRLVYSDIKYCLANYTPERLFIRLVGSKGGTTKVRESLENKTLDVKKTPGGLSFLINGSEVFTYALDDIGKGFSLAYERLPNEKGVIPCLPTGINPDDPKLPPVEISLFRSANMNYFLEIDFKGKIPLKFHSWNDKKIGWKSWCVDRQKK